jgi:glycosidase
MKAIIIVSAKFLWLLFLPLMLVASVPLAAQSPLRIIKIDPPNWYATLPKPMLLVRGEGFTGATFVLSDKSLRITSAILSPNGHWAQLWLSASPARPETVTLSARRGSDHVERPYTFAARRAANDGISGFSSDDAMYLIMTDRFADGDLTNDGPLGHSDATSPEAAAERSKSKGWHGGDLRGIEQHLDYLQKLGITTIWPTPVYQNHGPEAYHGYHCTDYYSVDEHYGSLDDLKSLVRSLHARGMKLVLDTVPNHVGPFHPWVNDEPAPEWFHGTRANHVATTYDFNYLIDPHSAERDRHSILNGWFVDELPDMNTENPAVSQYLRQNAIWWIEETGADALRIDTFAYVNRQFWHDYNETLGSLFPRLTEVGEVLVEQAEVASFFAGGRANTAADGTIDTGLFTPFDFPSYYSIVAALTGQKPMSVITDTLRSDSLYPHPERLVTLFGNHDKPRFLSESGADPARLRLAFGLVATMRGMPQLYYGDEVGMTGGEDPDNRKDMPGGFAGDISDVFSPAKRSTDAQRMHDWVQTLLQLRLRTPAIRHGFQQELFVDKTALALVRGEGSISSCADLPSANRYLAVFNVDTHPKDIEIDMRSTALDGCTKFEPVLDTRASAAVSPKFLKVHLEAETMGIFQAVR